MEGNHISLLPGVKDKTDYPQPAATPLKIEPLLHTIDQMAPVDFGDVGNF